MLVPGRCMWQVTAGLIPGEVEARHTRQWGLTAREWDQADGLERFLSAGAAAAAYAGYLQLLCSQGREVNWTRLEFVWF